MITIATTRRPGRAPRRSAGTRLIASVDVEWTKNYRIKNGNVPFCYSVAYLAVPAAGAVDLEAVEVEVISRYVEDASETAALVQAAASEIDDCLHRTDALIGHQLSSDLAVLAAAGQITSVPAEQLADLASARLAWSGRRQLGRQPGRGATPAPITDTRYDSDHVLTGTSRRLVDVCADLHLDVTQPELRGTSMTAVHRRWLQHSDIQARERVTVLNLRHSVSTALVALKAHGRLPIDQPVNVNRLLTRHLPVDELTWLDHPTFTALLAS